jgi:pyridoxal 5'-phosphate synthase pdxS subunit
LFVFLISQCRIGHFVEAQVLQSLEVDYIDESEVLSLADDQFHVDKHSFAVPFVCGCRNLGEALRRIGEGAAMIRTKGEAGTGNIVEAVRHARQVAAELRRVLAIKGQEEELRALARELGVGIEALHDVQKAGRLPVVQFAAGGVATPADAALLMQLGMDGVFVGSGIFKSADPPAMARAIVKAVTHYRDPAVVAQCCAEIGQAMKGLEINANVEQFAKREKV